jgi:F0F1-type ATP synthase membrane subunit c/vacuolar-type H+-ATPase subunit K
MYEGSFGSSYIFASLSLPIMPDRGRKENYMEILFIFAVLISTIAFVNLIVSICALVAMHKKLESMKMDLERIKYGIW